MATPAAELANPPAGEAIIHARIELASPMSPAMTDAITAACDRAETASTAHILVLWLSGPVSLVPWPGQPSIQLVSRWEKALRRLERVDRYTVSICTGHCNQSALEILLATDYRIATAGTTISTARSPDGIWPGMILHRLAQQAGLSSARRFTLLPADLTPTELIDAGVLDAVASPVEQGTTGTAAILRNITSRAGHETALRRSLLLDAAITGYDEALGVHLAACDRTLRRADSAPAPDSE